MIVLPVRGVPIIAPGDDLAALLAVAIGEAPITLQDDDVVVVAQKVVSKAEGRQVRLDSVEPSPAARNLSDSSGKAPSLCELILGESSEIVRVGRDVVIARHRLGHVLANAGIDASNVGADPESDIVLLWPESPDASALRLRQALQLRFGVRLAVIVSDSLGRAWRVGTTGAAIGVAGMRPLRDRRGERDLFGRVLQSTVTGVADEIAAAASLVIGEGSEGVPAAVVRGAVFTRADEDPGVGELLRPLAQDLFR